MMYLFIGGSIELLLLIKLKCFKRSFRSTSTNESHLNLYTRKLKTKKRKEKKKNTFLNKLHLLI